MVFESLCPCVLVLSASFDVDGDAYINRMKTCWLHLWLLLSSLYF